jgi:hypothetical protein
VALTGYALCRIPARFVARVLGAAYADPMESETPISLYGALSVPAGPGARRGETEETKTKETVDRDVEALVFEELLPDA